MRFEDYVTEQGESLLRLAYVLTSDAQRAEDLTQSVLADAYRHWRKVVAARHPNAYVRQMLVNAHLDWHRRRSSTERPIDMAAWDPGVEADPAEEVASRDQLRKALAMLTRGREPRWCCGTTRTWTTPPSRRRWGSLPAPSVQPLPGHWRPYGTAASLTP